MKNSEEKSAPMTARTSGEEEKSPIEEGGKLPKTDGSDAYQPSFAHV